MDYNVLKTEIDTDPLNRGYLTMTDLEAANDLNTEYRSRNRTSITGDEVFQATNNADFVALTDQQRNLWLSFTSKDIINPFATANVDFTTWVFGSGSTTLSNLAAIRQETVSRAIELGLGYIRTGDVAYARSL